MLIICIKSRRKLYGTILKTTNGKNLEKWTFFKFLLLDMCKYFRLFEEENTTTQT